MKRKPAYVTGTRMPGDSHPYILIVNDPGAFAPLHATRFATYRAAQAIANAVNTELRRKAREPRLPSGASMRLAAGLR